MKMEAEISECGEYRWSLTREWDHTLDKVCWIMLNPSTADAMVDDPTIRRCTAFSKQWGFGGLIVVNLFALRTTNPKELKRSVDPVGEPQNDGYILRSVAKANSSVAAWGAHEYARDRAKFVMNYLNRSGALINCLGTTKDRSPKHPLYVAGKTKPQPFLIGRYTKET